MRSRVLPPLQCDAGASLIEVLVGATLLTLIAAGLMIGAQNLRFGLAKGDAVRASQGAFEMVEGMVTQYLKGMDGDCGTHLDESPSVRSADGLGSVRMRFTDLTDGPDWPNGMAAVPDLHLAAARACAVGSGISSDQSKVRFCAQFLANPKLSGGVHGSIFANRYAFAHVYVEFLEARSNGALTCRQFDNNLRPGKSGIGIAAIFVDLYTAAPTTKGIQYARRASRSYLVVNP